MVNNGHSAITPTLTYFPGWKGQIQGQSLGYEMPGFTGSFLKFSSSPRRTGFYDCKFCSVAFYSKSPLLERAKARDGLSHFLLST